jgi:NADH:ubiquinone oxidoreductase subunit D
MADASNPLTPDTHPDAPEVDARTGEIRQETMIINMGPQHPSTHGVLRLLLELDGETVIKCTPIIGYLHTGIEKNTEYRTWMQGVTYVTRADYLSPFFNELGYCLAVERLLRSAFCRWKATYRWMLKNLPRFRFCGCMDEPTLSGRRPSEVNFARSFTMEASF